MESDGHAVNQHLPGNLRALREHQGMSQAVLATAMRDRGWPWHQTTVARVEGGIQQAGLGEATDLAAILRVPVDRLTWATGEAADVMIAEGAISRLRSAAAEAADALARFYAAQSTADRAARDAGKSRYERAREAGRAIGKELDDATLQNVLAEGDRKWADMREGRA